MSDAQTGRAVSPRQEFEAQLNEQVQNFRALLPGHIPVEKFKRVVVVAIAQNPELFRADRRSLFMAAQKCAADGLLPDARQAALVIYGNQVQYMPMIAGIRQRMRNSGEVLSAEAHVVYRNDKFFQKLGDDPAIVHEPPAFGVDRGDPVGAYAIIKLKNGEVLREVLDKQQIEKIRSVSKSKNGPAWTGWWDEMARKSALRRCAKSAPTSADIDALLAHEVDDTAGHSMVDITPAEPEPPRGNAITHQPEREAEPGPSWLVVDCDGEVREYRTKDDASNALDGVFKEAARRGGGHPDAALENNAAVIDELGISVDAVFAGIDESQPNSPTGINHGDQKGSHAKAASDAAPQPAGDTDLLGAEAKPQRDIYRALKIPPSDNDLNRWTDHIDGLLSDKIAPQTIAIAHSKEIDGLKQCDPHYYEDLMRKLGNL